MSPPRASTLNDYPDALERVLNKIDKLQGELSEVKAMLGERLVAVEGAAAKVTSLELRILDLEKKLARGEGALWAGRIFWVGLGAAGAVVAWVTGLFRPHP